MYKSHCFLLPAFTLMAPLLRRPAPIAIGLLRVLQNIEQDVQASDPAFRHYVPRRGRRNGSLILANYSWKIIER